jgi:nitroimidazol reductase NimA-like FMN-containing flavoprotein (pyridoxamine 5'-phosphate oxidase superfamily)
VQEDSGTIGSQSNLTDTATATIVPSTNSEEPKQKSRFIRRSKSVVVDGKAKELNVAKRKSQILSLFKRGNEKEKVKKNVTQKACFSCSNIF